MYATIDVAVLTCVLFVVKGKEDPTSGERAINHFCGVALFRVCAAPSLLPYMSSPPREQPQRLRATTKTTTSSTRHAFAA